MQFTTILRSCAALLLLSLAACGGGGGSDQGLASAPPTNNVVSNEAGFAARCANPRTGTDPATGQPYPDVAGTTSDENNWLRAWSLDKYLWYSEIVDADPALYTTPAYFDLMKTFATLPSGLPKDRFHFSLPTADWLNLSLGSTLVGYGAEWAVLSQFVPRQVVVAYTHPGTPATTAPVSLLRGTEILFIDGIDVVNTVSSAEITAINDALWPAVAGQTHTFIVRDPGSAVTRTFTMQPATITQTPVQNVTVIPTATGNVGYMLFLDHLAASEQGLIDAVNQLKSVGITDLVIDLRYNGGGYLYIASELAYMIAGSAASSGKTFESLKYNNKHPTIDPFTGQTLTPVPFVSTSLGYSAPANQPLPTLDLPRLFVLTGPNTCSASESIINSLSGINVQVIQIGGATCGKPYGYYPTDNCGTTYFSISFKGVNAKGFGDYPDGFAPANSSSIGSVLMTGCAVADDFTKGFGDPAEGLLAAALGYRSTQSCPAPPPVAIAGGAIPATQPTTVQLNKSPWLQNRIMGR